MTSIKKEDSPVAPAASVPKDPLAEIKELISGLTAKIGAMEGHMSKYDPSYGRGVDGKAHAAPAPQETEVQKPGEEVEVTGGVNKVAPKKVEEECIEEPMEKAEPVKTLPVYQGQKKQEDKELGPDKVSGGQYLNKEDIAMIVSSVIAKMGYTETPKAIAPVVHPLEKMEGAVDRFDMASLATMKFDKVNEIATRLMGGPRIG